jgi:hypothetical protein
MYKLLNEILDMVADIDEALYQGKKKKNAGTQKKIDKLWDFVSNAEDDAMRDEWRARVEAL